MEISGRDIGYGSPPYIVAEISGNHCGKLDWAKHLITLAKESGADAVKMQAYTPQSLTIDCDKDDFIIKDGPWKGRKLHELYEKTHTPVYWWPELFEFAGKTGITLFASVFNEDDLTLLEYLGCPAYKIASMEIVDIPLIRAVAATGKPMIISTGMASNMEIRDALKEAPEAAFLHCVSGYPTRVDEFNLERMRTLAWLTNKPIGISDHTTGMEIPIAAVALGANIIEKHLMIHRDTSSEDGPFSLDPYDFALMSLSVKQIYRATKHSEITTEASTRQLRRSLYVTEDIKKGEPFTKDNVRSIRPSYGLPPVLLDHVLTTHAANDITRGSPLRLPDLEKQPGSEHSWEKMWGTPITHSNRDFKEIKQ